MQGGEGDEEGKEGPQRPTEPSSKAKATAVSVSKKTAADDVLLAPPDKFGQPLPQPPGPLPAAKIALKRRADAIAAAPIPPELPGAPEVLLEAPAAPLPAPPKPKPQPRPPKAPPPAEIRRRIAAKAAADALAQQPPAMPAEVGADGDLEDGYDDDDIYLHPDAALARGTGENDVIADDAARSTGQHIEQHSNIIADLGTVAHKLHVPRESLITNDPAPDGHPRVTEFLDAVLGTVEASATSTTSEQPASSTPHAPPPPPAYWKKEEEEPAPVMESPDRFPHHYSALLEECHVHHQDHQHKIYVCPGCPDTAGPDKRYVAKNAWSLYQHMSANKDIDNHPPKVAFERWQAQYEQEHGVGARATAKRRKQNKKPNAPKHENKSNTRDELEAPEVGSLAYHNWPEPQPTSGQRAKYLLETEWDTRGGNSDEQWAGEGGEEDPEWRGYRDPTMDDHNPDVHEPEPLHDCSLAGRPAPPLPPGHALPQSPAMPHATSVPRPPSGPPPITHPTSYSETWHPNITFEDEHNSLVLSTVVVDYARNADATQPPVDDNVTHRLIINGRAYNLSTRQCADVANNTTSCGEPWFPFDITLARAPWQPSDPAPWTARSRPGGPFGRGPMASQPQAFRDKIIEERASWGGLGTWAVDDPDYSKGYPAEGSSAHW